MEGSKLGTLSNNWNGKKTKQFNKDKNNTKECRCLPEELAESLVIGDCFVVVLREPILNILKTPFLHQLAGRFGFLVEQRQEAQCVYY